MTPEALPEPRSDELVALFLELAAIPSPSRYERRIADLVSERLQSLGLEVYEDSAGEAFGGEAGNLWCRVPGSTDRPLLTLGAHLDTVKPTDLIEPVVRNGIIRNARPTILGADNKVAVASLLHATQVLLQSGVDYPTYDLFFSVGEEIGLQGAKHMDAERLESPIAVVFDSAGPVGGIVTRAPSQETLFAVFTGKAAHAGLEPEKGRNAIQAAAKAIAGLELGRLDEETTANVGVIQGGVAGNIVPERCEVRAECRSLDELRLGDVVSTMVAAFQTGAAQTGCEVEIDLVHEYRAFSITSRRPVLKLAKESLAALGLEVHTHASGGGSDANLFNERGVPAVNLDCGMNAVHTLDETVTVADLERVARLVLELVQRAPSHVR